MKRMLINATLDEVRVAVTSGALLLVLDIDHPGIEQKKANIYKGVITSIEPSLGAVFVDYGSDRHGFLPLKEISQEYFLTQDPQQLENPDIRKVLKEGQELVVQVDKEERGSKGAALTTFITLAGSYLVLMPNNPRAGGISRRIEGDERNLLRDVINNLNVPEGMGLIIRTAALERSKEELEWDLSVLLRYWEAIKQAAVAKAGPYLIHQESDVIIRAVRDYLRQDISEIVIDEPNAYERLRRYISQIRPDFINNLKLYSENTPIFSRFQIEQQIENAYQREVRLPSGGSMVIDHTEALVSIDINSARATKGSNIEETAYNTNLEAADELARQLRIRDIGGLIVIDFIDMTSVRNQRDVENRLRDAVKVDRARIQIGRISRFGLLEMSRQRLRTSLIKTSQVTCPRCDGQGTIRSVESLGLSIIHLIQEYATNAKNASVQVQLPIDVATYILNEKRDVLKDIEQHAETNIVVIPNVHMQSPHYHIRVVKDEFTKGTSSYKLVRAAKAEPEARETSTVTKAAAEPVIKDFLTSEEPMPAINTGKATSGGLIQRLWSAVFGSAREATPAQQPTRKTEYKSNKRPSAQRTPGGGRRPNPKGRAAQGQGRGKPQSQRKSKAKPRYDENRPEQSRHEANAPQPKVKNQPAPSAPSAPENPAEQHPAHHARTPEIISEHPTVRAAEEATNTKQEPQTISQPKESQIPLAPQVTKDSQQITKEPPVTNGSTQVNKEPMAKGPQHSPTSATSYQDLNYTALDQREPLVQVTTKKESSEKASENSKKESESVDS